MITIQSFIIALIAAIGTVIIAKTNKLIYRVLLYIIIVALGVVVFFL